MRVRFVGDGLRVQMWVGVKTQVWVGVRVRVQVGTRVWDGM